MAESLEQPTKHQVKTEETLRVVLDAAERIFVRDGFDKAQIETIAVEAGRTKGSVYAHFRNKEEIFFALLEKRVKSRRESVLHSIENLPFEKQIEVFRGLFVDAVEDENWYILLLEFKLFAMRNKDASRRMEEIYRLLYGSTVQAFLSQTEGLAERQKERVLMGMAILRGIPGAVVLEKKLDPALSSPGNRQVLEAIFDSALELNELRPRTKRR